jgi:hypothetical protein
MIYYNKDKLIKIVVNRAYPARWWSWKSDKNILGFKVRKAGYYDWMWGEWHGTEIPDNHQVINGELYEKPEVILHFQDDHRIIYFFDTYEQAVEYAKEITNKGSFI